MIVIADSGSTKCDWVILTKEGEIISQTYTMGFNPYFHNESLIASEIKTNTHLSDYADKITSVYYYGAGCSSDKLKRIVENALKQSFSNAQLTIEHDLLGAAYATYDGQPCISCILGTGSNSCLFDGESLHEKVPALGYILGDEGSGSYFGKKLVAGYLYQKLPTDIAADFKAEFGITMQDIVSNVYTKPHANVYLASFTRFISKHKHEPYFKQMLHDGMKDFLQTHVMCYENYQGTPVHFIGSIAFHFQDAIKSAADELGVKLGDIVQKPIENMIRFHVNYILSKSK